MGFEVVGKGFMGMQETKRMGENGRNHALQAKRFRAGLLVLLLAAAHVGCGAATGSDTDCVATGNCSAPGVKLVFEPDHVGQDFFAAPWPSDARLDDQGHPILVGFPNPANSSLLAEWLEIAQAETKNFGTYSSIYLAFDGPIDGSSLPTPKETMSPDSPVLLVDISDGPSRGELIPVLAEFLPDQLQFTPANTLVVRPADGFPLRSGGLYALVVTRKLKSQDGLGLGIPHDFGRLVYSPPPEQPGLSKWWMVLNPAFEAVEGLLGLDRREIAAMTVFSTQRVPEEMDAVAEFVAGLPPPELHDWKYLGTHGDLWLFEAWFDAPQYQYGEPPDYDGGGQFVFDEKGMPVPQRTERIAFTLAVPQGTPPAGGWPLVLYHHGTGGDRFTFCNSAGDVCDLLGERGVASIGISQPLHGERNPWGRDETLMTFNVSNARAFRDNFRQGAADMLLLERIARELKVPASIAPSGVEIAFDPERLAFMGHSQGGITGPIFLGSSRYVKGAVLSASGGGLGTVILERKDPVDIKALLELALGINDDEFDLSHPVIALFQMFAERADPINYARRILLEPNGARPRHVFFSEGLHDAMTMPTQIENMAAASGCDLVEPVARMVPALELMGRQPIEPPASGNARGPAGEPVTAVLLQYPDDGHFAVFENPTARRQYCDFLETLSYQGIPEVK